MTDPKTERRMKSVDVMIKVILFLVLLIGLLALMFTLAENGWGMGELSAPYQEPWLDRDVNPLEEPSPARQAK